MLDLGSLRETALDLDLPVLLLVFLFFLLQPFLNKIINIKNKVFLNKSLYFTYPKLIA